jgi:hypothetical protein
MLVGGSPLPAHYTYLNKGRLKTSGIEAGVEGVLAKGVNAYANYSWQGEPKPSGTNFTLADVNQPPTNRFNAGINVSQGVFLGDLSVTYQDRAFWKDVLNPLFIGWTNAFTITNGSAGIKWAGGRVVTTLKVNNIFNRVMQQHVFGDIIKRQIVGEARISF